MAYSSSISAAFQSKFNELANKKGFSSKKELTVQANKFFAFCISKVKDGDFCPFPCYLVENFKTAGI